MKQYQKAKMVAKNLPMGSYSAGCAGHKACLSNHNCEMRN